MNLLDLLRMYAVRQRRSSLQELLSRGGYSPFPPTAPQGPPTGPTHPAAPFLPTHVPFAWRHAGAAPRSYNGATWANGNAGRTTRTPGLY